MYFLQRYMYMDLFNVTVYVHEVLYVTVHVQEKFMYSNGKITVSEISHAKFLSLKASLTLPVAI